MIITHAIIHHHNLYDNDPGFGGLVRVMNKRNEFLWVHEKFAGEY
jgi:internalin A